MDRNSTLRWFRALLLVCAFYARAAQGQLASDPTLLQALGDHGDRISDLEALVKRLTAQCEETTRLANSLRAQNFQLKADIRGLEIRTGSCCRPPTPPLTTSVYSNVASTSGGQTHTTQTPISPTNTTVVKPTTTKPTTAQATTAKPTTAKPTTAQPTTANPTTAKPTILTTTTLPTTVTPSPFSNCDQVRAAYPSDSQITIDLNVVNSTGGYDKSVVCQFDTEGAWLIIQRRQDGSVSFNRTWTEYQNGFGDISGEFWIGNDVLHTLTTNDQYMLRIEFEDWARNTRYAEYQHFSVGSPREYYMLSVGSYSGTAGDSFHYPESQMLSHHRMMFSTPDNDHDHNHLNCAEKLQSGWWFNSCYSSNLNGPYLGHPYGQRMLGEASGEPTLEGTGVEWYPYRRRQYSLRKATMKMKITPPSVPMMG